MPYSDIQRWRYHALPHVFGGGVWTAKVCTETELNQVLLTADKVQKDRMAFVEVMMPRMDGPEILRHVAKQAAALNR
jgi:indolepyruvate decarboxylase